MARKGFDMSTIVKVSDVAGAQALLAKQKDQQFHHTLMLKRLIEVGECTCAELEAWLETNKLELMDEAHRAPWDKYAAAAHMQYFVNRSRGPVTAWKADGTQVEQTATKVKKAKVTEETPAAEETVPAEEAQASLEEALLTTAE